MATSNDITGDVIATKSNSPKYVNRFDWAFCKDEQHLCPDNFDVVHTCPSCGMKSIIDGRDIRIVV
jgi:hypothetical protein